MFAPSSKRILFSSAETNKLLFEDDGSVVDSLTGETISPEEEGYLQGAIDNCLDISLTVENREQAVFSAELPEGKIIAPFIVINSSLDPLLDSNPGNDPTVYFPFEAANSDGFEHIRTLGENKLGFEDLPKGGDLDFNDMIVEYNFL